MQFDQNCEINFMASEQTFKYQSVDMKITVSNPN